MKKNIFRTKILRISGAITSAFFLICILISGLFPWVYKQLDHEPRAINYSPDKRFSIEYYSIPFLPFRPHYYAGIGCTDCPGYIRLVNNSGDVLEEKYFQTRHEVSSGVDWEKGVVRMKLFANWELP